MSDNGRLQNSQDRELLSPSLTGSGDSCEATTSSILPSDIPVYSCESVFLTFHVLPEHRLVELRDVSVNDKLHDVLRRVEESMDKKGCVLAFIVVSGQIVKDRSLTIGSLFIPAITADASGNICGSIYGTYLDPVAIMHAKLVSYTSNHNSGIISTSTTGTGYTSYSFSGRSGARVKRLSREINEFFLKNPSPSFALCPSEDPNSGGASGTDDSIWMQGVMKGPTGTPYELEYFDFSIKITKDYPFRCPTFKFERNDNFPFLFDRSQPSSCIETRQLFPWGSFSPALMIRHNIEMIHRHIEASGKYQRLKSLPSPLPLQAGGDSLHRSDTFPLRVHCFRTPPPDVNTSSVHSRTPLSDETETFDIPVLGSDNLIDVLVHIRLNGLFDLFHNPSYCYGFSAESIFEGKILPPQTTIAELNTPELNLIRKGADDSWFRVVLDMVRAVGFRLEKISAKLLEEKNNRYNSLKDYERNVQITRGTFTIVC